MQQLWYGSGKYKKLKKIPKDEILVFDTETTGLSTLNDKILQISIVDGNGSVLFSSYIKPGNRKRWTSAKKVNHITYDMVKDAPEFSQVRQQIQKLFNRAKLIVGYNVDFDLKFIKANGIIINPICGIFDVMREYGTYMRTVNGLSSWIKLTACADHYGYTYNAHDAESDTQATLYCFNALLREEQYISGVNNYKGNKPSKSELQEPLVEQAGISIQKKKLRHIFLVKRLMYLLLFITCGVLWDSFSTAKICGPWNQAVENIVVVFLFYFLLRVVFPQGHYRIPFVIWLFLIFLVVGNLTAEINGLSGSGMVENGEWVAIMDAVHYSAGCLLAGLLQKICKRLFIV